MEYFVEIAHSWLELDSKLNKGVKEGKKVFQVLSNKEHYYYTIIFVKGTENGKAKKGAETRVNNGKE